jgi:hypothetical protein
MSADGLRPYIPSDMVRETLRVPSGPPPCDLPQATPSAFRDRLRFGVSQLAMHFVHGSAHRGLRRSAPGRGEMISKWFACQESTLRLLRPAITEHVRDAGIACVPPPPQFFRRLGFAEHRPPVGCTLVAGQRQESRCSLTGTAWRLASRLDGESRDWGWRRGELNPHRENPVQAATRKLGRANSSARGRISAS